MPSTDLSATTPVAAVDLNASRLWSSRSAAAATSAGASTSSATSPAEATTSVTAAVATSVSTDAGAPTIDVDRVALIRHAIENGTYPILPTKIGDAMIAAGIILRTGGYD